MKKNQEPEVLALIAGTKSGDPLAFPTLTELYEPLVKSLVARFRDGISGGEDVAMQEARIALFRAVRSYDETKTGVTFGLYAKICITNALISQLRLDIKNRKGICSLSEAQEALAAIPDDPSEQLITKERAESLLADARRLLSGYELAVFDLYIDGMRAHDIARTLDMNEKSVNNAIRRFREKLRQFQ